MKYSFLSIIIISSLCLSQNHEISTRPCSKNDYYANAIFLSQGPCYNLIKSVSDTIVQGSYRVVITADAVHSNGEEGYSIYIEQFTFGEEGCCRKFIKCFQIEPGEIMEKFNIDGEPWKLGFIKWLSVTSFQIVLAHTKFNISHLDKSLIVVSRIK